MVMILPVPVLGEGNSRSERCKGHVLVRLGDVSN